MLQVRFRGVAGQGIAYGVVEQGTLGGLKARGVLRLECLVSEIEDCVEEADE